MEHWTEHCRVKPYAHQIVGTELIVSNPIFALFDEMGGGKSKQVIDAAQILFRQGLIKRVLTLAPASVRNVWFDQEWGELAKHLWLTHPTLVREFHARVLRWNCGSWPTTENKEVLDWVITNYEFIRSKARLLQLLRFCDKETLLILDESSSVKNHRAQQTKASLILRKLCGRVVLLNGTPIANSPADMFSQGNIMDPRILSCASYFHFRSKYAIMGGWQQKQIVGWANLEDMQRRFKPYVIRRLKSECLDLPPKLPPVTLTATLTPETWHIYREMRDEMVAWLDNSTVSQAPQAVVKALRLAQVTSGFIGGVEDSGLESEDTEEDRPTWVPRNDSNVAVESRSSRSVTTTRELSAEKSLVFFEFLNQQLVADKNLKLLVWCRFRPELARIYNALTALEGYSHIKLGRIWGGQKRQEREDAVKLLDPRTMPDGPVVVLGTPSSGSMGLNLAGAHTVIYLSFDYNLKTYLQAQDRVHRPGQVYPVSYYNIAATGPQGQRTIDHAIIRALNNKENVATWTTSAWLTALTQE